MIASEAPRQPAWQSLWSIGFYTGRSPLSLAAPPGLDQPVLTGRHVTDVRARSVADPFLLRRGEAWELYYEVVNEDTGRGEIAFSTSPDGFSWEYGSVVLREPFHLSYPQVFEWQGETYMIPETGEDASVRLYQAADAPRGWRHRSTLLRGPYRDATILRHLDRWWLFAHRGLDELSLFGARELDGPWRAHPASPIVAGNRSRSRPGGRMVAHEGRLLRFAQDSWPLYGSRLRVLQIDRLNDLEYAEHEVPESPVLAASGEGWNAIAMHHMDAQPIASGAWLAAVDGATVALL